MQITKIVLKFTALATLLLMGAQSQACAWQQAGYATQVTGGKDVLLIKTNTGLWFLYESSNPAYSIEAKQMYFSMALASQAARINLNFCHDSKKHPNTAWTIINQVSTGDTY